MLQSPPVASANASTKAHQSAPKQGGGEGGSTRHLKKTSVAFKTKKNPSLAFRLLTRNLFFVSFSNVFFSLFASCAFGKTEKGERVDASRHRRRLLGPRRSGDDVPGRRQDQQARVAQRHRQCKTHTPKHNTHKRNAKNKSPKAKKAKKNPEPQNTASRFGLGGGGGGGGGGGALFSNSRFTSVILCLSLLPLYLSLLSLSLSLSLSHTHTHTHATPYFYGTGCPVRNRSMQACLYAN